MVSPTLQGSWSTRGEVPAAATTNLLALTRSIQFGIKTLLMGVNSGGTTGGVAADSSMDWILEGSSDGSTAGMDGVDRLDGSTFTASKWVRGASGVAHSWFVLSSSTSFGLGAKVYLLVAFQGATDGQLVLTFARTPYTGGSITANPTSTTETAIGTVTVGTPINPINDSVFGVPYFLQMSRAPGGEFFFFYNRSGAGNASLLLHMGDLRGQSAGDTWPTFVLYHGNVSGRGAGTGTSLAPPSSGFNCRNHSGSARIATGGPALYNFGGSAFAGVGLKDVLKNEWATLPIPVSTVADIGFAGARGYIRDVWWVGIAPVGAGYPQAALGFQTQIVIGDGLFPSYVPAAL